MLVITHPGTFYGLVDCFSDNPGFVNPDPDAWGEEVDPTAEDLAYFVEEAERQ